ncbi:hypothetical protein [Thiofilum flexile]|uniref:hypothetical protein n=1 Tax=Thiofilum flexile TaxID=125627 RepID=UPI000366E8F0|nr:hypothetical protein [Thiofilum flexile]
MTFQHYMGTPKVIWLKCGNQPRQRIVELLLTIRGEVEAFVNNPNSACLEAYDTSRQE